MNWLESHNAFNPFGLITEKKKQFLLRLVQKCSTREKVTSRSIAASFLVFEKEGNASSSSRYSSWLTSKNSGARNRATKRIGSVARQNGPRSSQASTRYRNEARAWPRGCVHATRGTRRGREREKISGLVGRKVIPCSFPFFFSLF